MPVAVASAVFVCEIGAWSPELPTRTETLTFKGDVWSAWAFAAACEPAAPAAPAPALALAAFDWRTGPSSPGLLTRAETLTFEGDA
jgi:hypothetical protein